MADEGPAFRDLSDLPKAGNRAEGHPADKESRFGRVLVDAWHAESVVRDASFRDLDQHGISGARFYHSDGGKCARAIAYAALDVPPSNPVDAPGHYIMRLGSWIHDEWQKALLARYPDADIEVAVFEDEMGGHADAEIKLETGTINPYVIVDELKSVGGYKYKLALGDRGPAQGPDHEHKVQGALNAKRRNADEMVITYLARDPFNDAVFQDMEPMARVTADWTYTREEYEAIADEEIARITSILRLLDEEKLLPVRKIPGDEYPEMHAITNPKSRFKGKGEWEAYAYNHDNVPIKVDAGLAWQCAYCRWQDTCAQTGAGRVPVDVLVQLGVLDVKAGDVAKVTSDTHPIVETDENGQRHVTVVDDTGEHEVLEGDPHEVQRVVVEIDRDLNREDQQ
jgi:hypothetical protein